MIIGGLTGMLILGLIGLFAGWIPVAKNRAVRGIPARFIGLIALLPYPISLALCFLAGFFCRVMEIPLPLEMREPTAIIIQLVTVLAFVALLTYLSYRWSDPRRFPEPGQVSTDEVAPGLADKPATLDEFGPVDGWLPENAAQSSGMARASLMLGIFSLLTSLVASIPAFILGGIALARIERSGGRIAGKGAAIAGIVLGIFGIFTGAIALALIIPFLRSTADPGADNASPPIALAPPLTPVPPKLPKPGNLPAPTAPRTPNPEPDPLPTVAKADPAPRTKKSTPSKASRSKTRAKGGFDRSDNPAPTVAIDTKPTATGVSLASKPKTVGDLKVTELKVDAAKVPRCLIWGEGGQVVFVLETDGTLRRIKVDGFVEESKWEVGQPCSWLSASAEGLVLTVDSLQEIWLLDPLSFSIKSRTPAASVTRADSSPAISYAFATGKSGDTLAVIDLKAGKVVRDYDSRSFPNLNAGYARLAVAPDGKSIFTEGMERLMRFDFAGDELNFAEQSDRIAANGRAIEISDDGAYVALPSGGGNYTKPPYTTYVYRTANLAEPDIQVKSGAYPQAIGFDLKAGFLYAQNNEDFLILFQPSGTRAKSYRLPGQRGKSPRQFLVHPDGGKLLALTDSTLSFLELPAPSKSKP